MKSSTDIKQILPALLKAQGAIKPVAKTGENPHFHSAYAKLEDVIEEAKKVLNSNDIWLTQLTRINEGGMLILETVLVHKSGEWVSTELPIINKAGTDQGLGSSLSYTKRYSLLGILGISTHDDDGESASKEPAKKPAAQTTEAEHQLFGDEPFSDFGNATGMDDHISPLNFDAAKDKYGEQQICNMLAEKDVKGASFYESLRDGHRKFGRLTPPQTNALKKAWIKVMEGNS